MKHYPYRRNTGCRLLVDQSWCGYHAVTLQNAWLRVTVLPEKGGDIIELLHKPTDIDALFLSPNGLRRPDHAEPTLNTGPGLFMDRYPGAWQEILPSAGPPSSFGGITFGQHGEISLLPWRCEVVADDEKEVAVRLTVQAIRTPFVLQRTMRMTAAEPRLMLEENLTNLSPQKLPVMWGHHPTFGGGFLDESCQFEIRAAGVEVPEGPASETQRLAPGTRGEWPQVKDRRGEVVDFSTMPPRTAKFADFFFLSGLAEGRYRVINSRLRLAVEMNWDKSVMPHLWFWQVAGGGFEYPWWGQTYSMALEPFTSKCSDYAEAAQSSDALILGPYASRDFHLSVAMYPT